MTLSLLAYYKIKDFFQKQKDEKKRIRFEKITVAQTFIQKKEWESISEVDRVCLYSSYDAHSKIPLYVAAQLKYYRDHGFKIVFVTTSQELPDDQMELLKETCSVVIQRKNAGLDFCSWKLALDLFPVLFRCKGLLLTNDSVFGPFNDFLSTVNVGDREILGITDSFELNHHLQSYFLLLGSEVVKSKVFHDFMDGVRVLYRKADIIHKYELGFTAVMEKEFTLRAMYSFKELFNRFAQSPENKHQDLNDKLFDPTMVFWNLMLSDDFPFLKRSLLTINPYRSKMVNLWFRYVKEENHQKMISQYVRENKIQVVF